MVVDAELLRALLELKAYELEVYERVLRSVKGLLPLPRVDRAPGSEERIGVLLPEVVDELVARRRLAHSARRVPRDGLHLDAVALGVVRHYLRPCLVELGLEVFERRVAGLAAPVGLGVFSRSEHRLHCRRISSADERMRVYVYYLESSFFRSFRSSVSSCYSHELCSPFKILSVPYKF